jgi:hypothetical protein
LLPGALPAAIEHHRAQRSYGITCPFAPLHAPILLPPSDDQIIRLLDMGTPDGPTLNTTLPIVHHPGLPRLQIPNQFVQFRRVLGFHALRLQHCYRALNISAPQAAIQPAQQPGCGELPSAASTAKVGAFLPQLLPVEEHRLIREPSKCPGTGAAERARAIGNQEQAAERPHTPEHGYLQALEERRADPTQVTIALLGRTPRRASFQKVPCCWLARQHFVEGHEELLRLQVWSEVAQLLDRPGYLPTPGRKHTLPICP